MGGLSVGWHEPHLLKCSTAVAWRSSLHELLQESAEQHAGVVCRGVRCLDPIQEPPPLLQRLLAVAAPLVAPQVDDQAVLQHPRWHQTGRPPLLLLLLWLALLHLGGLPRALLGAGACCA
jgi:hypothetical protein